MLGKISPVNRILSLVRSEHREISSIYFFAILNGLILLVIPVGIQTIIGFAQTNTVTTSIILLIVLVVASVLAAGIVQIKQMQIIEKIQQRIFVKYSFAIAEKIPTLKLAAIDNYHLPELMNRFFDIGNLQKGLAKLMLDFPLAIIQILFGLLLLAFYHPVFIAFGLIVLLIISLILYFSGTKGLQKSIEESTQKYKVAAWLEEMARIIRSVKFAKATDFVIQKTDGHVTQYLQARTSHYKILELQYKTLVVFKMLVTTAMLLVGVVLLINQQLNVGQFIAAEIVILTILSSVEKLISNLDNVYDVLTAVEKIEQLVDKPEELNGSVQLPVSGSGVSIALHNLGYTHPQSPAPVFRNLSLSVNAGEKVCMQGEEGAGKSTLLRLLSGTYEDFEGTLLLDNIPIHNYDHRSLRFKTGTYISQQDIFEGTLLENLCFGLEEADITEIQYYCDKVGLTDFISKLKKGFDTLLFTNGRQLPTHAIKKILLVRALMNKPRLLLLEEPWAGLEEVYQQQIKKMLLSEMPDTTVIIATQDAGFAAQCHRVIRLEKNRDSIIEK